MTDNGPRVKVYVFDGEQRWNCLGTGHVLCAHVEQTEGMSLLVTAENDSSLILESKIKPDTTYQKQQQTLIVWTEAENYDLALSFQEKDACDDIWEQICQAQGKESSLDITEDLDASEESFDDLSSPDIELPACELSCLGEIAELVTSTLLSPLSHEKLALALEKEGYIKKLLQLFHMCEDLDFVEGLHHLHEIIKGIFLLKQTSLFEIMFSEECIMDVIGCLEYDPALSQPQKHREFLTQTAKFKEAIPISDPKLKQKIHQTFRIQYIQDTILPSPSILEEEMLPTLHSFILFNKIEIVDMLQEDKQFMTDLFAQLTDEATDVGKRQELVNFLKEFCVFSLTLQSHDTDAFFKTLSNMGILPTLEFILNMNDIQVRNAATDIVSYLVDYNPSMVGEFVLQKAQQNDGNILFIRLIIEHMICDTDPELGGAVKRMDLLQTLLDPENVLATASETEKSEFLGFFYAHCMHLLTAPLLANTTEDKPNKDDFQTAQLLALILELLTFCVERHTYHIKNYIIDKDILRRVLVLMASKHAFLALCALRFKRKIIGLKDEFYNCYIMESFLFEPVVKAFLNNGSRYNLMNSAIIEMFEFIRVEDIKSLTIHVVENYWKALEDVDYVQTFKGLKLKFEQQRDNQYSPNLGNMHSSMREHDYQRNSRTLEDEKMEVGEVIVSPFDKTKNDSEHNYQRNSRTLEDGKMEVGEAIMSPFDKTKNDGDVDLISKFMETKKLQESEEKEVLLKTTLSEQQSPHFILSLSSGTKTNFTSPSSATNLPSFIGSPGSPESPDSPDSVSKDISLTAAFTTKEGLMNLGDYPDDNEDNDEGKDKENTLPLSKKAKSES